MKFTIPHQVTTHRTHSTTTKTVFGYPTVFHHPDSTGSLTNSTTPSRSIQFTSPVRPTIPTEHLRSGTLKPRARNTSKHFHSNGWLRITITPLTKDSHDQRTSRFAVSLWSVFRIFYNGFIVCENASNLWWDFCWECTKFSLWTWISRYMYLLLGLFRFQWMFEFFPVYNNIHRFYIMYFSYKDSRIILNFSLFKFFISSIFRTIS